MSNWLLLASSITLISLDAVDSVMTRMALRKGYHELNPLLRKLIEELGLDGAMLVKALLPMPFVSVAIVALILSNPGIAFTTTILSIVSVVVYGFVVLFDCIQLLRPPSAK